MATHESLSALAEQLVPELKGIRYVRNTYGARLAPDFNYFDVVEPNETRLSKVLACLLNPNGTHAQGSAFLQIFIRHFGLEGIGIPREAHVYTEAPTTYCSRSRRRIDILIEFPQAAVAIENKPWDRDRDDQVTDYVAHLQGHHQYQDWRLIYISGSGTDPAEISIPIAQRIAYGKEGKYRTLTYSDLVPWLEECEGVCRAERVRRFLEELRDYIHRTFEGASEMEEREAVIKAALTSPTNLTAALNVGWNFTDIQQTLLNRFRTQLEVLAAKRAWTIDWKLNPGGNNSDIRIYFRIEPSQKYYLSFSPEYTELNRWMYGVAKVNDGYADQEDIRNQLNEKIGPSNEDENSWWPWYQLLPAPYHDWRRSEEPWMEILDDEAPLAKRFIDIAGQIHDVLSGANLLEKL